MKIDVLTNIIPSYRDIFFEELSKLRKDIKIKIYICAQSEPNRNWELKKNKFYNFELLKVIKLNLGNDKKNKKFTYFSFNILVKLIFARPDFLIIGDAGSTTYLCIIFAKLLLIPYLVCIEDSRELKEIPKLTRFFKKLVFKICNYFVVPSFSSQKLLNNFGIKNHKIKVIRNAVNNNEFINLYKKNKKIISKLKNDIGLKNENFCFLIVAQLIERKRIMETIQLLDSLTDEMNIDLIIVGKGYLYNQAIERLNKTTINYHFFADLNNEELSRIYTVADCLILLSKSEPWGMVINESLLHNLPCITTNTVQAANMLKEATSIIFTNDFENIDKKYILKKIQEIKSLKHKNNLLEPYSPNEMAQEFFNFINSKISNK